MNSSINTITSNGSLYSKLQITNFILSLKDKTAEFLSGAKLYFQKNRTSNVPGTVDGLDGYCAAMEFSKVLDSYKNASDSCLQEFRTNIELANTNYAALNESYTAAFHEQQQRIKNIQDQTNNHFSDFEKSRATYRIWLTSLAKHTMQNNLELTTIVYTEKILLEG